MARTGGLPIDFRQGTFRSPHASPGGKLQQMQQHSSNASQSNSNKGGTSSTTAKGAAGTLEPTSMKQALIANQHFYNRQKSNKTEVVGAVGENSNFGQKDQQYFAEDVQSQGHKSQNNAVAAYQQTNQSIQDETASAGGGVYGTRRDTANFFTVQQEPNLSASLPQH